MASTELFWNRTIANLVTRSRDLDRNPWSRCLSWQPRECKPSRAEKVLSE